MLRTHLRNLTPDLAMITEIEIQCLGLHIQVRDEGVDGEEDALVGLNADRHCVRDHAAERGEDVGVRGGVKVDFYLGGSGVQGCLLGWVLAISIFFTSSTTGGER